MARSWSGVSSKRKAASNSRCHGRRPDEGGPLRHRALRRRACSSSSAISRSAARTDSFTRCQAAPPSRSSRAAPSAPPMYFEIEVEPLDGQVEPAALGVLEEQEVGVAVRSTRQRAEPVVAADAVRPRAPRGRSTREVGERGDGGAALELRPPQRRRRRAPKISSSVSTTRPSAGSWKPAEHSPTSDAERLPGSRAWRPATASSSCSAQDLAQARGLALVVDDQPHREALGRASCAISPASVLNWPR